MNQMAPRNANRVMNSTARTYMMGCTWRHFPAKILPIGYRMKPTAIPVAMLKDIGIIRTVKNAGTASDKSFQSISRKLPDIRTPTMISAGEVIAATEAKDSTRGKKKRATRNQPAVVTAVKPVLPPAATPADDSMYEVTVEVPMAAPAIVARES